MVGEEEYDELSLEDWESKLPCCALRAGRHQTAHSDAPYGLQVRGSQHLGGGPEAAVRAQPGGPQGPALQSKQC